MVVLIFLCIVTLGFTLICLYTKQAFQLKVAKILTIMFALLMAATAVGMAAQMATDLHFRSTCDKYSSKLNIFHISRQL